MKKSICFTGRGRRSAWFVAGAALAWLRTASAPTTVHADEAAGHEAYGQSAPLPENPGQPRLAQPGPAQSLVPLQPPSPANSSIEELNGALMEIDCAWLRGRTSAQGSAIVSGTVPDADQKARLGQIVGRFFPDGRPEILVDIVPPPLCRTLAKLNVMRHAGLIAEGGVGLRLNDGSWQLRQDEPIKLEVRAPAYAVDLRIDYFALDGQVMHLAPEGQELAPRLAAGTTHLFGQGANGQFWKAGGAPFGTELITVIATPSPLNLGSRWQVEGADEYLSRLKRELGRCAVPSGTPNLVAMLLVRTESSGMGGKAVHSAGSSPSSLPSPLTLVPPAQPPGREAYDGSDYARAMSEWQSAADRGNPQAQFGLGCLYELGAGALKQDYKRADFWYQKAAEQGYVEAQYRLALIWAVGGEHFPPDLAEAYKWVLLAAASKSVWAGLAADLKIMLDKVASSGQQAEGQWRATKWNEEHNPKKEESPVAAPPLGSAGEPAPPGCPGWPFPTLPCTEQFPAAPPDPGKLRPLLGSPPFASHGPAPLPPSPLNAALEVWRQLDAELNRLLAGNVAFNTPDHMRVGKSRIIEAKLSVSIAPDALIMRRLRIFGQRDKLKADRSKGA